MDCGYSKDYGHEFMILIAVMARISFAEADLIGYFCSMTESRIQY